MPAPELLLDAQQEEALLILSKQTELYKGPGTPRAYCKCCSRVTGVGVGFRRIWHTLSQAVLLGLYLKSMKYSIGFSVLYVKRLTAFWICLKFTAVCSDNGEVNSFLGFQQHSKFCAWGITAEAYMSGQKFKLAFQVKWRKITNSVCPLLAMPESPQEKFLQRKSFAYVWKFTSIY